MNEQAGRPDREGHPGSSHRPPRWWPEGEPWPPPRWDHPGRHGWGKGERRSGGHGRWGPWRPLGCIFVLFGLFAAGTVVLGLWAAAAILRLVQAPGVVVAAGIVAFVVIGIATLAAARWFRKLTRPLDELIEASARIEAGDYATRVSIDGSREIRSLGRAFNQMSERLETSERQRRAFLADVTHELRTPLTVLQGQLEAIGDGVYEPDADRIAGLLAHARQMSGLVEDLHTISLAEVGSLHLTLAPTELTALIDDVVSSYLPAAQLADIELTAAPAPAGIEVSVDASAMRRVIANLTTNAIRHTAAGGHVRVGVRAAGAQVLLDVVDDGSGMESDFVERAFERFEKGAGSDGSGLGLAIARDLVEAQHGSIALRSELGQGTAVTITLPSSTRVEV